LPQITQRLQQTLGKLQKPQAEVGGTCPPRCGGASSSRRYADSAVRLSPSRDFDPQAMVPTTLFDSVADNLLQNALLKRQI
jgi:hypothetical protein